MCYSSFKQGADNVGYTSVVVLVMMIVYSCSASFTNLIILFAPFCLKVLINASTIHHSPFSSIFNSCVYVYHVICLVVSILPANTYQCFPSIHLLLQYGSDKDNVNHLLRITTHFDLEVYTKSRKDKHLQSLLNILRDIVDKQSDQTVSVCGYCKCYPTLRQSLQECSFASIFTFRLFF